MRRDGQEAGRRLLEAAAKIVATKGFHQAKVAEICRTAQANVAAVNYHFGSKKNLYQKAWKNALENGIKIYPPDGGAAPEAPFEDRLHGRIPATISRGWTRKTWASTSGAGRWPIPPGYYPKSYIGP